MYTLKCYYTIIEFSYVKDIFYKVVRHNILLQMKHFF